MLLTTVYQADSVTKKKDEQIQELNQIVENSQQVLMRAKSVFPFQLFPDTVIVDTTKVDIIYSDFFWHKFVFTIPITAIKLVKINVGLFFATMLIEVTGFETNPDAVTYLWRNDAVNLRKLITGLQLLSKHQFDFSNLDTKTIRNKAMEIGNAQEI